MVISYDTQMSQVLTHSATSVGWSWFRLSKLHFTIIYSNNIFHNYNLFVHIAAKLTATINQLSTTLQT